MLTINYEVAFTQAEAKNLGRYLTSGGFLYTDIVSMPLEIGEAHRQREWDRAHGISGRITGADELPAYDLGCCETKTEYSG